MMFNHHVFKTTISGKERHVLALTVQPQADVTVRPRTHHVMVADVSGSMYPHHDSLLGAIEHAIHTLDKDDLFSVYWYSGAGNFGRVLSRLSPEFIDVSAVIKAIPRPHSCTCFSEVLAKVRDDLIEQSDDTSNTVVTLFTDGAPVVPWSLGTEIERVGGVCHDLIEDANVSSINTIGYGRYYDEKLMKSISGLTANSFMLHVDEIEHLEQAIHASYTSTAMLTSTRISVEKNNSTVLVSANGGTNNTLVIKDEARFRLASAEDSIFIMFDEVEPITVEVYGGAADERITWDVPTLALTKQSDLPEGLLTRFFHAMAAAQFYRGARAIARDILGNNLRDRHLVTKAMTAFTRQQVSEVQVLLNSAVVQQEVRMVDGACPPGFVAKPDALCALHLLHALADTDCVFFPYHEKSAKYNRVTLKATDEENRFIMPDVIGSPIEVVTSKNNFNASIRVRVDGHVKISKKSAERVGLPEMVPANTFRNFTVIKDCDYNLSHGVFRLTQEFLDWAAEKKLGKNTISAIEGTDLHVVKFKSLPLSNSTYAEDYSADDLGSMALREFAHQCMRKAVRYQMEKTKTVSREPSTFARAVYTADQIDVLKDHGVNAMGSYIGVDVSRPSSEDSDYYEARFVNLQVKGGSAIPSVEKVLEKKEKIEKGGKGSYNQAETIILDALFNANGIGYDELRSIERELTAEILNDNTVINQVLMSKVSTGDWFEDMAIDDKSGDEFVTVTTKSLVGSEHEGIVLFKPVMKKVYFTADSE